MPTHDARLHRHIRSFAVATLCLLGVLGCEDDQAPTPEPAGIVIASGDAQYTRKGTQLEEPVAVRVTLEGGAPAAGVAVQFQVIEGGGTLSRTLATTNSSGRASVRWTMGPDTGTNRLRISVADNSSLSVIATATSSEYYCAEEDPAFVQKFAPARSLMMLTHESSHTTLAAGVIRYSPNTQPLTFVAFTVQVVGSYPDAAFPYVVRDAAFSANGDLFLCWNHARDEIVKVAINGSVSHFATLETNVNALPGAELAMTPNGVLVGCDAMGPFYVTCRDSLFRFEDAIFSGDILTRDAANNDALACDPTSGDVYFIYKENRWLYRIPFDGTTAGAKVQVAQLPIDESDGARGMVVDGTDGAIYILVESANTKSIVKVTPAGVRTTAYNFFDRGAGDAAGVQNDLAIDRQLNRLYTLDTLNNVFLRYDIANGALSAIVPAAGENPESASDDGSGERVGLDVVPGP